MKLIDEFCHKYQAADVVWEIGEYDGREWVAEKHRTWS